MTTLSWRLGVLGVVVASAWSTIFFQPQPRIVSWFVEDAHTFIESISAHPQAGAESLASFTVAEELYPILVKEAPPSAPTLQAIKRRGVIKFLIPQGATSYFLYRCEQMGFEYELAVAFAQSLGVELEVITPPPGADLTEILSEGNVDIGAGLVIADESNLGALFPSISYLDVTSQILTYGNSPLFHETATLSGQAIAVRPDALYARQALDTVTAGMPPPLVDFIQGEDGIVGAMRMLAQGQTAAILVTAPLAEVARKLYPGQLRTAWTLSKEASTVWAVRPGSPELLNAINAFLNQVLQSGKRKILFEKYFVTTAHLRNNARKQEMTLISKRLTRYDRLIAHHAEEAGFDWRFIAAVIFEESRFDHERVSGAGAYGLMQIMPIAAQDIGVKDYSQPASNIEAGIKYLQVLARQFPHGQPEDRLALVLASYVMGMGHMEDAQRLARTLGYDPDCWTDSMERVLPLLEKPRYHKKAQYGAAQGREAVRYVNAIRKRYSLYSQYVSRELPGIRSRAKAPRQAASASG
ncbi:MAG: transporter substrate-binding domain-containing protein [Candidatus Binatia bacterium]